MTYDIIRNTATGELQLIAHGDPIPDGWVFEAETANPEYLAAIVPATTPRISQFGFLSRFSREERSLLRQRTDKNDPAYDPILDDGMFMLDRAERIDVSLPLTQQLVGYMAVSGLIAPERVPALLAEIETSSPHAKS